MVTSKKLREQLLELCGSLGDEDTKSPKEFHQKKTYKKRLGHKNLQLCEQVGRTLMLVLPESKEERIRDLIVERVRLGKNAGGLRVELRQPDVTPVESRDLLALLRAEEGWLRSEVANAITRKRVPRLTFEFVIRIQQKQSDSK